MKANDGDWRKRQRDVRDRECEGVGIKFVPEFISVSVSHAEWYNLKSAFPRENESMVSLVLRQYMRGENGTESLVGCFFLSCLFE